jgi:hypothetical protein
MSMIEMSPARSFRMTDHKQMTPEEQWRYAEPTLRWHGWGSPVGLGIVLLCASIAAVLVRLAILGF